MNKPTHYLIYITEGNVAKNKLQEEFAEYLRTRDRELIPADRLKEVKKQIKEKAQALSENHTRCKPLDVGFWYYDKKTVNLDRFYVVNCKFLAAHES